MKILKFLGLIGVLAILGSIGAAAFFFGGFFSVAANHPDPYIVNWALVRVREASIARHATDRSPGSLDDPDMVREGARAYSQRGWVIKHGIQMTGMPSFAASNPPKPDSKIASGDGASGSLTPSALFQRGKPKPWGERPCSSSIP